MDRKTNIIIVEMNRLHRESLHVAQSQIANFTILPDADTVDDIVTPYPISLLLSIHFVERHI
jgi:hypothetical protein